MIGTPVNARLFEGGSVRLGVRHRCKGPISRIQASHQIVVVTHLEAKLGEELAGDACSQLLRPQFLWQILSMTACMARCSSLPVLTDQRALRLCQSKFASRRTSLNNFGSIWAFCAISAAVIFAVSPEVLRRSRLRSCAFRDVAFLVDRLPVFIGLRTLQFYRLVALRAS